jgi:hypothetical protein
MAELSDKTEEIRLREVREGRYHDCAQKLYAEKVVVDGVDRCRGSKIGAGGSHVPMCCETCPVYCP